MTAPRPALAALIVGLVCAVTACGSTVQVTDGSATLGTSAAGTTTDGLGMPLASPAADPAGSLDPLGGPATADGSP